MREWQGLRPLSIASELFESAAELLLFLEQFGELDAELGGRRLYLGEAEGELPLARDGLGVAPFGTVALADVLEAFRGVAAHAVAVGLKLFALHVFSYAL